MTSFGLCCVCWELFLRVLATGSAWRSLWRVTTVMCAQCWKPSWHVRSNSGKFTPAVTETWESVCWCLCSCFLHGGDHVGHYFCHWWCHSTLDCWVKLRSCNWIRDGGIWALLLIGCFSSGITSTVRQKFCLRSRGVAVWNRCQPWGIVGINVLPILFETRWRYKRRHLFCAPATFMFSLPQLQSICPSFFCLFVCFFIRTDL